MIKSQMYFIFFQFNKSTHLHSFIRSTSIELVMNHFHSYQNWWIQLHWNDFVINCAMKCRTILHTFAPFLISNCFNCFCYFFFVHFNNFFLFTSDFRVMYIKMMRIRKMYKIWWWFLPKKFNSRKSNIKITLINVNWFSVCIRPMHRICQTQRQLQINII